MQLFEIIKDKMGSVVNFILSYINKGQDRSVKAKKNIISSVIIKGISIAISLILVPLTIHYVNPTRYGIWITMISIVGWVSFFDIGLTQGLRNKFAVAKANGEDDLAQIYVSTTFGILAVIFSFVWILFIIVNNFLDWASILNVPGEMKNEVSTLAIIVFTYFCLQFVFRIINTVIVADQQPAKSSLIDLIGQLFSLLFVAVLVKTTEGSLIKLGIAFCLSPIVILIASNFYFFKGKYKKYSPRISKIKFNYAKGLFNLGIVFFIIQVAGIIQYQTANIIIARNFGTLDVTSYNIVFKYFGMLNMVFVIFLTPFWSASTEAYLKKDFNWIKKSIRKYNQLNFVLILLGLIMLFFSDKIYQVWLGKGTVDIAFTLSMWGFLYFSLTMFAGTYVYFLNGINALRIQFIASLISPFIYIAIALLLIKHYKMGAQALFIASIIANFNGYLLSPLQYHLVVNKKKKGIWVK